MKICNYRNCNKEIIGRTNKKYCTINCQRNEKKYRQRMKNKIKNEKTNK